MVKAMYISFLKTELARRGVSSAGHKQLLKDRLLSTLATNLSVKSTNNNRACLNPGTASVEHCIGLSCITIKFQSQIQQ